MTDPIASFEGQIYKVQTIAAGGFRVTIDGSSVDIASAAFLMPYADAPVTVRVTFEELLNSREQYGLEKGTKRKSEWKTTKE